MPDDDPDVRQLHAEVDLGDTESEFRILVSGKFVKYLTIDAGLYSPDDMCFEPSFISIIPKLPPGDWNEGHISKDAATGRPHFAEVMKSQHSGITNLWHATRIDHLELQNRRKFARFPWEIPYLEAETTAYQWIDGHQIGPKFLGHLSEEGRVIGFLMVYVSGAKHAGPEDFALCQATLSRLHDLEIKHGDIDKHNFLIHDGKATLIDVETATRCSDKGLLDQELKQLEEELRDTSGRGGSRILPAET
ncbi:hypothetical protein EJ08DRAFT_698221 [Tothia fuscella]|uniref:Alpha-galactosidase A n=1 Tax=Tothia fuscella TaxID=1048955 RepID=A0A9P4TXQ9_9PEZI|nr:hypothetical protein EJ08DRAFT_698221 [Tothia fuscella]